MRWWDRLTEWDEAHPTVADGFATVGSIFVMLLLSAGIGYNSGWLHPFTWTVALGVPLAARRAAPATSAIAVYGLALLQLGWGVVGGGLPMLPADLFVLVALYSVTVHGPVWAYRSAAVSTLFGALALGGAVQSSVDDPFSAAIATSMVLLSAAAVFAFALVRRSRRERLDGLRERARRLEVERDQQLVLAATAERARIAREMHDIVAHSLSVIIAQADGGRYAGQADPAAATRALETVAETGRAALADMRRLLGVLRTDESADARPAGVDLRPMPAADELGALVEHVRDSGLEVSLVRMGTARTLPPGIGLAVYRVCQESLTNILKHAGPQAKATVLLQWQPASLLLEVTDDGRGAAATSDGAGQGLTGMRERATMLGGTLTAGPRPGGGFRIRMEIPLPLERTTGPVPAIPPLAVQPVARPAARPAGPPPPAPPPGPVTPRDPYAYRPRTPEGTS
jgi:signal transduction histidine kinase